MDSANLRVRTATSWPLAPACSVGWVRLRRGACGWAATAPKLQRVTVTTTTTTTVFEDPAGGEAEPEAEAEVFWRDDPAQCGARAHTWRQEAEARWIRFSENLIRWRGLLGFCGSVLNCSQARYLRGRIATGVGVVSAKAYAGAIADTRWQRASLRDRARP